MNEAMIESSESPVSTIPLANVTKPPISKLAIMAFVLSFLLVLAPLGVLFGVAGIVVTWSGRKRGRGFAIASIPIGVMVSVLTTLIVITFLLMANVVKKENVVGFLKSSQSTIASSASETYDGLSDRFKVVVSEDAFQEWALATAEAHGTLQDVERGRDWLSTQPGNSWVLNLTGKFVNGPANIKVTVGVDWGSLSAEVDDIAVDGVSPKRQG